MIRRAKREDIGQIAEVHVASWKTTYRGIVSDTFLDSLTSEQKISQWTRNLEQDDSILLVAVEAGQVVGFVSAGKSRSDHFPFEAEIYAIYILKDY
ncbi:GNAT family N-acetyltransferase [Alkalihalobacillus sp. TS-13]|uniref:GNAT family N-acetyltransferase n=1 Tax=Alkalihalobacillus sp. TS-13 TaxID=2842455 RepID=UPI001C869E7C|nr:GNAT family N-acetyltransferase [Alkalihalobacillus sp. TS-13]